MMRRIEDFVTKWMLPPGWLKIIEHLTPKVETTGDKISIVVGELIAIGVLIAIYLALK